MNDFDTTSGKEEPSERRVKSVNFTDLELYEYANKRADSLYGGNFSAYVTSLIERERSVGTSNREIARAGLDLERRIQQIIDPFGGRYLPSNLGCDFEILDLRLGIEALLRFPRHREREYALVGRLQRALMINSIEHVMIVIPDDLPAKETQMFKKLELAGICNLTVCGLGALKDQLESMARSKKSVEPSTDPPAEI